MRVGFVEEGGWITVCLALRASIMRMIPRRFDMWPNGLGILNSLRRFTPCYARVVKLTAEERAIFAMGYGNPGIPRAFFKFSTVAFVRMNIPYA